MDFSIKPPGMGEIKGRIDSPGEKVKGVIILIHGLGEHYGRYSAWIAEFNRKEYAVIGADLPGHGLSEGKRGDIPSLNGLACLVDKLTELGNEKFPGKEQILYGHSLGGLIVLNYLFENPGCSLRSIVTSPWLKLSFEPPKIKMLMASVFKSIVPSLLQPTGLIAEHISHDPAVVEAYINDPLVHDKISVRHFYDCWRTSGKLLKNRGVVNNKILLMHGADDLITSPSGSELFAGLSENTTLKVWDGGFHELHNEPFSGDVFEYIINWIESDQK